MPTVNRINLNKNGYAPVKKQNNTKPIKYINKELPRKNLALKSRLQLPKFMQDAKINHEMNFLMKIMRMALR